MARGQPFVAASTSVIKFLICLDALPDSVRPWPFVFSFQVFYCGTDDIDLGLLLENVVPNSQMACRA